MRSSRIILGGLALIVFQGIDLSFSDGAAAQHLVTKDAPVPVLIEVLGKHDPDRGYRNHRRAADLLGERQAREAVPVLIRNLDSLDEDVIRECAIALGKIGHPSAAPALIRGLESDFRKAKNPHVIGDAIIALGKIGLKATEARGAIRPVLKRYEREGTREQARWAKRALGYWGE